VVSSSDPDVSTQIIAQAKSSGASLAGIASISSLKNSPFHKVHREPVWPQGAKSVLVLGLHHKETEPELDWWDGNKGTPGNRRLIDVAKSLIEWLKKEFNLNAQDLPYHVEKGGIFLKDAAVLAGLGTIGMNNLLITPEFGPRVRFRALVVDVGLEPTSPIDFAPCESCDMHCGQVCPQDAFRSGSYSRMLCNEQMEIDITGKVIVKQREEKDLPFEYIKYCRACELACPVGK
jgi:epoxyqueuosine reductase